MNAIKVVCEARRIEAFAGLEHTRRSSWGEAVRWLADRTPPGHAVFVTDGDRAPESWLIEELTAFLEDRRAGGVR